MKVLMISIEDERIKEDMCLLDILNLLRHSYVTDFEVKEFAGTTTRYFTLKHIPVPKEA